MIIRLPPNQLDFLKGNINNQYIAKHKATVASICSGEDVDEDTFMNMVAYAMEVGTTTDPIIQYIVHELVHQWEIQQPEIQGSGLQGAPPVYQSAPQQMTTEHDYAPDIDEYGDISLEDFSPKIELWIKREVVRRTAVVLKEYKEKIKKYERIINGYKKISEEIG